MPTNLGGTTTLILAKYGLIEEPDPSGTHQLKEVENLQVLVEDSKIVEIRYADSEVIQLGQEDQVVDLGESLLLPGFIDLEGLVDIDHLLIDSWWDDDHYSRLEWSLAYAKNPTGVLTPQEQSTLRRYGLVQLLMHGITSAMPIATEVHSAWAETYNDLMDVAETATELGIRLFLGPSYRSGVHVTEALGKQSVYWDEERGEQGFAEAVKFVDDITAENHPLLTGVFVPCRIETVTDELLTQTAQFAEERNALVRVHATQGIADEIDLLRETGRGTPLEVLQRAGLLNERLILAHGVYLDVHPDVTDADTGDLQTLASHGVSIAHCPVTNARYAFHLEKISQYLDAGINIGLGTDSFPPDLIRAVDTGVQVSKAQHDDLGKNYLAEYIDALTRGGATALHRPDLGRIAVGATADLTAFQLDDFRMGVLDNPLRTLVLSGTARDCVFTMVQGKVVMREGLIPGQNLEKLRAEAQAIFEKLKKGYTKRDILATTQASTVQELFPPVFTT